LRNHYSNGNLKILLTPNCANMQYREKLIELIFETEYDEETLFDWISEQPVLDQVDILNEFRDLIQDMLEEAEDESLNETMAEFDKAIDEYKESYLDEQLANLKYELAVTERDKAVAEMLESIAGVRAYIRECIETNAPNAEAMKGLARKLIELDKNDGLYDPANWDWFVDEN